MKAKNRNFAGLWRSLEAIITEDASTETVFNPYRDSNSLVDLPDAAEIRTRNLRGYMSKAVGTASILVVGEAAGPWECRFSGVPFTGERQLLDPAFPIRGDRSSRHEPACATRTTPPFVSASAAIFWNVLLPFHRRILVWNAFPLHPHRPNDDLTVRTPTREEISRYGDALRRIRAYLNPEMMIAVGRKASGAISAIGEPSVYVRHPSQGGKRGSPQACEPFSIRNPAKESAPTGYGKSCLPGSGMRSFFSSNPIRPASSAGRPAEG